MNDYQRIFTRLGQVEPPANLEQRVYSKIALAGRRQSNFRLLTAGLGGIASVLVLVLALQTSVYSLSHTGFINFFSLLFTDGASVFAYWQEFALSLVESLPIIGLILVLASIWGLLSSIRLAVNNRKKIVISY